MRQLIGCGLLLIAGCRTSPPAVHADVVAAIRSAPDPDRLHAINQSASRQRGEPASLAPMLAEPDPRVRWAAAYVAALWADDQADADALAPYLNDSDEATRAVIAGSLAGLGHEGARESLKGLTTSQASMPFSDPPITVGRFASDALAAIHRAEGTR